MLALFKGVGKAAGDQMGEELKSVLGISFLVIMFGFYLYFKFTKKD